MPHSNTGAQSGPDIAPPLEVFIVDDDTDFARYVSDVAKSLGFATEIANNAKALMTLFDERRPAAVIMDHVMPDMDGVELIQWLGKHRFSVPVIVMSGYYSNYADSVETIGAGSGAVVIGKLAKPFEIAELEAILLQVQEANQ